MINDSDARPSLLTRRRVVGTAAWTAPAIVVASAVPAFAASTPKWTIASASYEGDQTTNRPDNGVRANTGDYRFKFTIVVAAGSTVSAPMVVLDGNATDTPENGNGLGPLTAFNSAVPSVTTVTPTGTVDAWTVTGSGAITGDSLNAFRRFTFMRADLVGPTTVTLNFSLQGIAAADIGPGGNTVVFSSSDSSTQTFTILEANTPAPTDPAGLATTGPVIT